MKISHFHRRERCSNTDTFESEEWSGYSSKANACCNMFGPTDMVALMNKEEQSFNDPDEAGLEDRADYYVLEGAGHGSREFFQDSVKQLMISFFDKYL